MEVYVHRSTSACQDISSHGRSTADPHNSADHYSSDLSMNDLKMCLTECLNVEDIETSAGLSNLYPQKNDPGKAVMMKDGCIDLDKGKSSGSTSGICFSKCATFPPLGEPKSSVNELLDGKEIKGEDQTPDSAVNPCYSWSISLPTPSKPVSAMKGSREKQGVQPKKLSVTWAPDVYDPIPTSVSHVPSNKNLRYRGDGKRYGKNKQKGGGKSSRGKSKEKKQSRKVSGVTTKFKPLPDDGVVVCNEPRAGIVDFNVGGPDPFCGSSFLKKSVTKMHFPVAEAK